MKIFGFIIIIFLISSCGKEDNSSGTYPAGIIPFNRTSNNDCNLPPCSDDRKIRFVAKGVEGEIFKSTIGGYLVFYPFTFDSFISFRFCNLPEEYQQEGLKVKYDGVLLDACGIYMPEWPDEEVYILKITKISKL